MWRRVIKALNALSDWMKGTCGRCSLQEVETAELISLPRGKSKHVFITARIFCQGRTMN